ncbi:hypothetical protein [Sphingosinicella sp. BN140058]|uniref:hypothetical protein n=1 Tax=Sphingosinicella sp. BN140058 TaxID=1892855 RepID=UPI0010113820|nr:hypothetical protein [Sphingosinicella sp. BN140058]QAY79099.1 hypothetical protein ETR14_23100 [Sphingosinicella sp. BN140058]
MALGRRAAALLLPLLLGDCRAAPMEPEVPSPPSAFRQQEEYAFGDTIAAADTAAVAHVVDVLGPRFGRPEVARYVLAATVDLARVEAYYANGAKAAGWRPLPDIGAGVSPGERAFAFRSDRTAFAVVAIAPRPGVDTIPANVIRFHR